MPLQIIQAVIHGFEKLQHTTVTQSVTKKPNPLNTALPAVAKLVTGVADLLGRKLAAQTWGRFDDAELAGHYPPALRSYASNSTSARFMSMTHVAMDAIVVSALTEAASTGSHVLFAHYQDDNGKDRMLIAMIKQKGGIQLDANFVPIGITEVDMDKLSQAADVRISDYEDDIAAKEIAGTEPDDYQAVNYLTFLSQRAADNAASYFIKALGCVLGITPSKATSSAFEAVDAFMQSMEQLAPFKREARDKLSQYLREQLDNTQDATLSGIAHAVRSSIPAAHIDLAADLESYLNGETYQIPTEFPVHKAALAKYSKVKIETDEMQLKFNRSLMGKTEGARVFFNAEERSLKISNLSPKIIAYLNKELTD